MRLSVEGGELRGDAGLVHFPLPLRRWYEDLVCTWANILLFRSEETIECWCQWSRVPRDEALILRKTWELSKAWYHNWLSPSFMGRTAEESSR